MKKFVLSTLLAATLLAPAAFADDATIGEPTHAVGSHPYDKFRIGPGDMADILTTSWGLNVGLSEGNGIMRPFTDAHNFLGPVAAKAAGKVIFSKVTGKPAAVTKSMETVGMGAGCANIVTITGGEPAASLAAFIACTMLNSSYMEARYIVDTHHTTMGKPATSEAILKAQRTLNRYPFMKYLTPSTKTTASGFDGKGSFIDPRTGIKWTIKNNGARPFTEEEMIASIDKVDKPANADAYKAMRENQRNAPKAQSARGAQQPETAGARTRFAESSYVDPRDGSRWTIKNAGSFTDKQLQDAIDNLKTKKVQMVKGETFLYVDIAKKQTWKVRNTKNGMMSHAEVQAEIDAGRAVLQ